MTDTLFIRLLHHEDKGAVLVEKIHHRGCGMQADFVGLQAPDRYLFGCGMDYRGWGRNLPGIHAIREEDQTE